MATSYAPSAGAAAVDGGFRDVLCAIDGTSDSLAAVSQAATLTAPDGRLTLLTVTSFRSAADRGSPAVGPAEAKEMLDRAVAILEDEQVDHAVEVDPAGPPARVILDWAVGRDLLAIGAPSSSTLGGVFVKGVGDSALGSFTTPLLLARPATPHDCFARRMLVASDALDSSDELVELAGRLAHTHGAEMTLLHAVGPEGGARPRRIQRQARRLSELAGSRGETRLDPGSPRTAIVEAAREVEASLVLMSSRRLKGLRSLGSVSRHVAHNGHCSVMLVPPEHLLGR